MIPALQALGTAAIVTAGGSLVADFWLPGVEPVKFGALCGVVSLGGVWWEGIRDDAKRVWYELERRFGVDLDGDGVIGEPEPQPRQTAIDEVDDRAPNGAPRTASLTWLPISPEQTQKLAVALVVDDVLFSREDLKRAKAIKHNDYGRVMRVLLDRRYLRKIGGGVGVTFAGYRWFCKKIPRDMDALPYTSLSIGRL